MGEANETSFVISTLSQLIGKTVDDVNVVDKNTAIIKTTDGKSFTIRSLPPDGIVLSENQKTIIEDVIIDLHQLVKKVGPYDNLVNDFVEKYKRQARIYSILKKTIGLKDKGDSNASKKI
jgi:hypothetical protein